MTLNVMIEGPAADSDRVDRVRIVFRG